MTFKNVYKNKRFLCSPRKNNVSFAHLVSLESVVAIASGRGGSLLVGGQELVHANSIVGIQVALTITKLQNVPPVFIFKMWKQCVLLKKSEILQPAHLAIQVGGVDILVITLKYSDVENILSI